MITGDRVAVEPGVPCEKCWLCREGRYNLCEDVKFAGVYPYHGTLQRFKVHPAKWLHKYVSNLLPFPLIPILIDNKGFQMMLLMQRERYWNLCQSYCTAFVVQDLL